MENKKFTVIGGDLRSAKLANFLKADGNRVYIYGFNKDGFVPAIEESKDLSQAIDESDIVIGPIPCSTDDETINTPLFNGKININEVFKIMNKNQIFMAGRISEKIAHLSNIFNIYCVDLLEREDMSILNAVPTAEGAIQIAMEEMPITLHNCNALVLGFGRIGKILAKILRGIGANVYVEARKFSDIAWIRSYGYNPVFLNQIGDYLNKMDVIFNTIPYIVLDSEALKKINSECLIIDLASKPGGVDFGKAGELGLKTIWALSLPGKVAPVTAAGFIKDTIYNILDELGV